MLSVLKVNFFKISISLGCSRINLEEVARAIHRKGAALDNCWDFVDGTIRPICRPGENWRVVYNGHKRVHCLKFQSVVPPNGMIANLFGPIGESIGLMSWSMPRPTFRSKMPSFSRNTFLTRREATAISFIFISFYFICSRFFLVWYSRICVSSCSMRITEETQK